MYYWLVYEHCEGCTTVNCLQCLQADRDLTVRVVQSDDRPVNALHGPCLTSEEILRGMTEYFGFDEITGKMYFKVDVE